MFAKTDMNESLSQSSSALKQISEALFSGSSFWVLILALVIGWVFGKVASAILRRISRSVGKQADASSDLTIVNRLRGVETWMILSIAVLRVVFIILALYFWWVFTHPTGSKPTALVFL